MIKENHFYIGESVDFIKENISDDCIDVVVTSPPYDNLRMYRGYSFDYKSMLKELYRILKLGWVLVWVVGDATVNGSETLSSFKHALYAKEECGFNVHDTMIFNKTSPFPANVRYQQDFEYMFVFSKGKPKVFNPLREPKTEGEISKIKKIEKLGAESVKSKSYRKRDGSINASHNNINRLNRLVEAGKRDDKIMSNIWKINAGYMINTKDKEVYSHPASFPEKLAENHILSWSNENDIILDPMCGSGTVCKMAFINNRKFIGIDMSEEYIKEICIPRLTKYGWKNE